MRMRTQWLCTRLSLQLLGVIVVSAAHAGVIDLSPSFPGPVPTTVTHIRHKWRADGIDFKNLWSTRATYNPAHAGAYQLQVILGHRQQAIDNACQDVGTTNGIPVDAQPYRPDIGIGVYVDDYLSNPSDLLLGKNVLGLRSFDLAAFPRLSGFADGNTGEFLISSSSPLNADGKDISVDVSRGDTFQGDLSDWGGRNCSTVGPLPATDSSGNPIVYRTWHTKLSMDGKDYHFDTLVPDAMGKYLAPDWITRFVTEFFELPGFYRGYVWDVAYQTEGSTTWVPMNTWSYTKIAVSGNWGVRLANYAGNPVIELSNDGSASYLPTTTPFTLPAPGTAVAYTLPVVNFSASTQTRRLTVGSVTVTAQLSGTSAQTHPALYLPIDVSGTATNLALFDLPNPASLVIPANSKNGRLTFQVTPDHTLPENKTIVLKFNPPACATSLNTDGTYTYCPANYTGPYISTGVAIGETATQTITILKDPTPIFDASPLNLELIGIWSNNYGIRWNRPKSTGGGLAGYKVYRYSVDALGNVLSGGFYTQLPTQIPSASNYNPESFVDEVGTTPGTVGSYKYIVTAVDALGHETQPSNSVVTGQPNFPQDANGAYLPFTLPTINLLSPPATNSLAAHLRGIAALDLWSDAFNLQYGILTVQYFIDGYNDGLATASPYHLSIPTASLGNGSHSVIARAWNGNGGYTDSAPITVQIGITPPSTPTGLSAAVNGSAIQLSWNAAGAVGGSTMASYRIYRNGLPFSSSGLTTFVNLEGVVPGVQYCYTVSAVDSMGLESPQSAAACA